MKARRARLAKKAKAEAKKRKPLSIRAKRRRELDLRQSVAALHSSSGWSGVPSGTARDAFGRVGSAWDAPGSSSIASPARSGSPRKRRRPASATASSATSSRAAGSSAMRSWKKAPSWEPPASLDTAVLDQLLSSGGSLGKRVASIVASLLLPSKPAPSAASSGSAASSSGGGAGSSRVPASPSRKKGKGKGGGTFPSLAAPAAVPKDSADVLLFVADMLPRMQEAGTAPEDAACVPMPRLERAFARLPEAARAMYAARGEEIHSAMHSLVAAESALADMRAVEEQLVAAAALAAASAGDDDGSKAGEDGKAASTADAAAPAVTGKQAAAAARAEAIAAGALHFAVEDELMAGEAAKLDALADVMGDDFHVYAEALSGVLSKLRALLARRPNNWWELQRTLLTHGSARGPHACLPRKAFQAAFAACGMVLTKHELRVLASHFAHVDAGAGEGEAVAVAETAETAETAEAKEGESEPVAVPTVASAGKPTSSSKSKPPVNALRFCLTVRGPVTMKRRTAIISSFLRFSTASSGFVEPDEVRRLFWSRQPRESGLAAQIVEDLLDAFRSHAAEEGDIVASFSSTAPAASTAGSAAAGSRAAAAPAPEDEGSISWTDYSQYLATLAAGMPDDDAFVSFLANLWGLPQPTMLLPGSSAGSGSGGKRRGRARRPRAVTTSAAEQLQAVRADIADADGRMVATLDALGKLPMLPLSHSKLEVLPDALGELTPRCVWLSNAELTSLPAALLRLSYVEELQLSQNALRSLPADIVSLSHLTVLSLTDNGLTRLPGKLRGLPNLHTLLLARNRLLQLPAALFKLPSLSVLDASSNRLSGLPTSLSSASSLTRLLLGGNKLAALPEQLSGCRELRELQLQHNLLAGLPAGLCELRKLETLLAFNNQLSELPMRLGSLSALRKLLLYNNNLRALPPSICALRSLTTLALSTNKLEALPDGLSGLTALTDLACQFNLLSTLPDGFGELRSLRRVWLHQNQLASLPDTLAGLTSLRMMTLYDNCLKQLPASIGKLSALTSLSAGNNQLTALPVEAAGLVSLVELRLEGNPLAPPLSTVVSTGVFRSRGEEDFLLALPKLVDGVRQRTDFSQLRVRRTAASTASTVAGGKSFVAQILEDALAAADTSASGLLSPAKCATVISSLSSLLSDSDMAKLLSVARVDDSSGKPKLHYIDIISAVIRGSKSEAPNTARAVVKFLSSSSARSRMRSSGRARPATAGRLRSGTAASQLSATGGSGGGAAAGPSPAALGTSAIESEVAALRAALMKREAEAKSLSGKLATARAAVAAQRGKAGGSAGKPKASRPAGSVMDAVREARRRALEAEKAKLVALLRVQDDRVTDLRASLEASQLELETGRPPAAPRKVIVTKSGKIRKLKAKGKKKRKKKKKKAVSKEEEEEEEKELPGKEEEEEEDDVKVHSCPAELSADVLASMSVPAAPLKVHIGTWNVGNASPDEKVAPWIPEEAVDIVALGAQECVKKAEWQACLAHNGLESAYDLIAKVNMWEMRLYVFVAKKHTAYVCGVETAKEATGIAHVAGNKGGQVVSFSLYGTSLAFLNSHLAAHEGAKFLAARNQNVGEILGGARVGIKELDATTQFAHCFWMGDLNYRVDMSLVDGVKRETHEELWTEVEGMVRAGKYGDIFAADQLAAAIRNGEAFVGFTEGVYDFPPTFKVKRREELTYNPKRTPSYCDRVLWKSQPALATDIEQTLLASPLEVDSSDHKCLYARFNLKLRPPLPLTDDSSLQPTVTLLNVAARELAVMDIGGSSDPYLKFFSHPPAALVVDRKQPRSATVSKSVSPAWKEGDIPPLRFRVSSVEQLAQVTLLVAIFDHDTASSDDLMGVIRIDLADAAGLGEPVGFDMPVELNGAHAGVIKGDVLVEWPAEGGVPHAAAAPAASSSSGGPGCCVVS
eukprot:PLAT9164.1.p1 GENE.PLAT9164.1~~PLAT9164.1.p1  ORF type:complete len:1966 (-),score=1089.21 PLAT9164.1:159-5909(-)